MSDSKPSGWQKFLRFLFWVVVPLGLVSIALLAGYLLGMGATTEAKSTDAAKGFFDTVSPPVWIILFLNVASFLSAITAAYATVKVTPGTALKVADMQAGVARESITVAATSADAASRSATAASRSSENQGIHAVARLRQEWINELRGRVAEAHALLGNFRPTSPDDDNAERKQLEDRQVKANETMARIELLLNPTEPPSKALIKALRALANCGGDLESRMKASPPVIKAAQKVLKEEWDRVRDELQGKPPKSADRDQATN